MTLSQEFSSFFSPPPIKISPTPKIGSKAPSCPELSFPSENGNPTIVSFLRHCGCPVAEKTYLNMRTAALKHPNINFIAISHSDSDSTTKWLEAIGGSSSSSGSTPGSVSGPGAGSGVKVIIDPNRTIYSKWGLGTVPWSHVLSPAGLVSIWNMGRDEGIWNRPTESGSRWQGGGSWGVDGEGVVRWGGVAGRVDDVVQFDFEGAVGVLTSST